MLPRGSIFQYGFLGGGQFKKYLKKWTFWPKSGGLFKKKPKNWTFQIIWGYIQEWGSISVHTVDYAINFLHLCPLPDLMPIFLQC